MGLSKKQKKYIRRKIAQKSLEQIAQEISAPLNEIKKYAEKLKKKKIAIVEDFPQHINQKIRNFSFRSFLEKNQKAIVFLFLLVLFSYLNSLNNEFVSDDISGIVRNPNIGNLSVIFKSIDGVIKFFQHTLWSITYLLFGPSPAAFRSINILFHLGSVLSVYLLVYLLSSPLTALGAAAVTAVHPIMTESVTWISGIGYVSYSFFSLLSAIFYLFSTKERKYLYFSLASFLLALSISEKAVILPLLIFLLNFSWQIRHLDAKRIALLLIPAIGIVILFLSKLPGRLAWLESAHYQRIPKFTSLRQAIIYETYLIIISTTSYLNLIFWPKNLTLYHSEMSFTQREIFTRAIFLLVIIAFMFWGWFKNKRVFFWLFWFFVALSPTLTPFGVSWIVAERYAYLASIGIFVLLAMGLVKIGEILGNYKLSYLLLGIILLPLTIRTIIRNNDWQNQDTLWLAAAKTSPSSPQNHNNLGDLYSRRGEFEKAVEEFKTAIKLNPRYADAYHNLANVYWQTKDVDKAIAAYQKAIELNPRLWQSYQNLAAIYFQQKKLPLAEKHLHEAIRINPRNPNLHLNLAIVYLQEEKKSEAKEQLQQALKLDPQNQKIRQMLFQVN